MTSACVFLYAVLTFGYAALFLQIIPEDELRLKWPKRSKFVHGFICMNDYELKTNKRQNYFFF